MGPHISGAPSGERGWAGNLLYPVPPCGAGQGGEYWRGHGFSEAPPARVRTLGLHLHSNPDGYVQRNKASVRKRQRLLSPPPALRHRTFYSKLVYLPFPLLSALSAACA